MALISLAVGACSAQGCPTASKTEPVSGQVAALYDVRTGDGVPAVHSLDMQAVLEPSAASTLIERIDAVESVATALHPQTRAWVQNDLWGLWQRLSKVTFDAPQRQGLLEATHRSIRALAPSPDELARWTAPRPLPPVLDGFQEYDSELVSLQHERLYGMRRLFRIFLKGDHERALASRLVVLDRQGQPHATWMVGEIEMLEFATRGAFVGRDGGFAELIRARVFDRQRAPSGTEPPPLVELETVEQVPSPGANGFVAQFFGDDQHLENLPCLQCHDDGDMMSLPTPHTRPEDRHGRLLAELQESTVAAFGEDKSN